PSAGDATGSLRRRGPMRRLPVAIVLVTAIVASSLASATVASAEPADPITGMSIVRTAPSVFPVKDGYRDTVSFEVRTATESGSAHDVDGTVRILSPDRRRVVREAALASTLPKTFTWNGRLADGRLVEGRYPVVVTIHDDGDVWTEESAIGVSAKRSYHYEFS